MRRFPEIETRRGGPGAGKLDYPAELTEILVVNDRMESGRLRFHVCFILSRSGLDCGIYQGEPDKHCQVHKRNGHSDVPIDPVPYVRNGREPQNRSRQRQKTRNPII